MVSKESIFRDIDFYWEASKINELKSRITVLDSMSKLDFSFDAAALLTEWQEFKNLDFSNQLVFDGRGIRSSSFYSIGKG